jgi:serine/threonine-protein kinase RsbW
VIEASSTLRLELDSRPESPALVRAALAGVTELLEFDAELFHDLNIAVSEACNNVVLHAYDGEPGPLVVSLEIQAACVEVIVRDWGGGIQQVEPSEDRMGVGLAVMSALADRAEFVSAPDGGAEVRMAFAARNMSVPQLEHPPDAGPASELLMHLSGDVIGTVSPVELLRGVLGRIARAVSARAHFSLDRLSDVSLVTDAIASFAKAAAAGAGITFSVIARERRLELVVGPVRAGCGAWLHEDGMFNQPGSPLAVLAGELTLEPVNGFEMLRVVVEDPRATAAG